MNKDRRSKLSDLKDRITKTCEVLSEAFSAATSDIQEIRDELEAVRDEEQEAFDNMPEGLQQGERGQASEAAIEAIESALSELENFCADDGEEALMPMQSAIESIEGASE